MKEQQEQSDVHASAGKFKTSVVVNRQNYKLCVKLRGCGYSQRGGLVANNAGWDVTLEVWEQDYFGVVIEGY